jgi:hypothetical protein
MWPSVALTVLALAFGETSEQRLEIENAQWANKTGYKSTLSPLAPYKTHEQYNRSDGVILERARDKVIKIKVIDDNLKPLMSCQDMGYVVKFLESEISDQSFDPDRLKREARRLNSVTRSRLWHTRMICGGLEGANNSAVSELDKSVTGHKVDLDSSSRCYFESGRKQQGNTVKEYKSEHCVDEPGVQVRRVNLGEVIREGAVASHTVIPSYFQYKNQNCRWFQENNVHSGDAVTYQGIICETSTKSAWQVIDKF